MGERIELVIDRRTRKWVIDFAAANYWRVAAHIDLEDLLQDGMMLFHKCRQKYREEGRGHAHIINTFKQAFRNHVTNLAIARTRDLEMMATDVEWTDDLSPRENGQQEFTVALQKAPFRVREALAVYTTERGRDKMRKPYHLYVDGSRETLNDRLCKVAGFDRTRVQLTTTLREYFATD